VALDQRVLLPADQGGVTLFEHRAAGRARLGFDLQFGVRRQHGVIVQEAAHGADLAGPACECGTSFAADLSLLQSFDEGRHHGLEVGQGLVARTGIGRRVAHDAITPFALQRASHRSTRHRQADPFVHHTKMQVADLFHHLLITLDPESKFFFNSLLKSRM